jgi:uncharacterized protein YcfJ
MVKTILIASMLAIVALGSLGFTGMAYAVYSGNVGDDGETGQNTLEETLELAKRRIDAVNDNPASGSGTPYLDANGVVGASIISGAVFGGIAGAFFIKGRSGRYAAQGRG